MRDLLLMDRSMMQINYSLLIDKDQLKAYQLNIISVDQNR